MGINYVGISGTNPEIFPKGANNFWPIHILRIVHALRISGGLS